jgi:hypothetical protein
MSGRGTRKQQKPIGIPSREALARNILISATTKTPSKAAIKEFTKQIAAPSAPKKNVSERAPRIAKPRSISLSITSTPSLTDINLTALSYTIFGEKYIRELMSNGIINTVRDIWELSTPTTQCENIIGKTKSDTKCWICDLPLGSVEGLTPECEHILPIAQAVIYLGLFSVSAEKKLFPTDMYVLSGEDRKKLQLEYRWAHRVCNQIKNDDSYLDFDRATGSYIVNQDKIRDLLKRIKTNTRSYGSAIKPLLTDLSAGSAIETFQAVCDHLNSYAAPRLLELAGLISSGYGPRKVGVNRDVIPLSDEERISNMRREIIKANIEYSGVIQKTIGKLEGLPRLGMNAGPVFLKIVEARRPEYVSLFMRIKPTQSNMSHLIAYIRQQLLNEFASVDAEKELGIQPLRRKDATQVLSDIIKPIMSTITITKSEEFNEELMDANKLYQEDSSIGDTIRTVLAMYNTTEGEPSDEEKLDIQKELTSEFTEVSDPGRSMTEYEQIIQEVRSISSRPVSDNNSIVSDPAGMWIDNVNGLKDLLTSTDQWSVDEVGAVGILSGFKMISPENLRGGRRTRKRVRS